jgi:hypothetical protein
MSWASSIRLPVEAKTASYTITTNDFGKMFTNRGDTDAITFTLPAVSTAPAGVIVWFYQIADFNMAIAGTAGELVTHNDAAANSVTYSTAGDLIGTCIAAVSDGTSWLIMHMNDSSTAVTETVGT